MVEKKELITIRIPVELKNKLESMKIHRNQPIYEVIENLLNFFEVYKGEVKEEP